MTHLRSRHIPIRIRLIRSEIPMMDINRADSITLTPLSSDRAGKKTGIDQCDAVNMQMFKQKRRKCKLRNSWKSNPFWIVRIVCNKKEWNLCLQDLSFVIIWLWSVDGTGLPSGVCNESRFISFLLNDSFSPFFSFESKDCLKSGKEMKKKKKIEIVGKIMIFLQTALTKNLANSLIIS